MSSPYTLDPNTGLSTPSPSSGQVPVTANANGSVSSPYDTFATNMMNLLQNVQSSGNNPQLALQGQNLQQQAINAGNPNNQLGDSSVFQGMTPAARLAAEQGAEQSFQPGILSVQAEQQYNAQAAQNEATAIQDLVDSQKPIAKGLSDDLVTPGGTTVSPGFNPNPDLNTGNYIGYGGRGDNSSNTGSGTSTNSSSSSSGNASTQVNGYEFGDDRTNQAAGGLGAYTATDSASDYAGHVRTIVNGIQSLVPTGSPVTANALDQYIANQNFSSKSPISGQMIMNAAQTYGVDPAVLAGVLDNESSFGTAGSGAETNNPGNQQLNGHDITYNTMQQGINATAKNLVDRKLKNYTAGTSTTSSSQVDNSLSNTKDPVGGTYSNYIAPKIAQLPQTIQSITRAGPLGVGYIDGDQLANLPQQFSTIATVAGSKAGIPVLNDDQSSAVKDIGNLYQYIANLQPVVNKVLSNDQGGFLEIGANKIHNIDPNYLTDLTNFNSIRTSAINTIQALAGGSGSGLRLSQGEIDSATAMLPTASDTLANANIKINNLQTLLKTKLASTFPYVQGNQPGSTASNNASSVSTISNGVDLSKF